MNRDFKIYQIVMIILILSGFFIIFFAGCTIRWLTYNLTFSLFADVPDGVNAVGINNEDLYFVRNMIVNISLVVGGIMIFLGGIGSILNYYLLGKLKCLIISKMRQ